MKKILTTLCLTLAACGQPHSAVDANVETSDATASSAALKANHCALPAGSVISLPADDAAHDAVTEWWYYTGHLAGSHGRRFGFELVFFQLQNAGGGITTTAHFAVTDSNNQAFYSQTSTATTPYKSKANGFDLRVPAGWSAHGGNGHDHLSAQEQDYGIELEVHADGQVAINDGDGHIVFPDGSANYYYSRPKMDAEGTVRINGEHYHVSGDVWFDHQWGALPFTTWTWYGIQLDNGEQIMAVQVRTPDNSVVIAQAGTFVGHGCTQTPLAPTDLVMTWQGTWTSPSSGVGYPTSYTLGVPSHGVQLDIVPVMQDQELLSTVPASTYREAESTVSGTENGTAVKGMAFVENVNMVNLP